MMLFKLAEVQLVIFDLDGVLIESSTKGNPFYLLSEESPTSDSVLQKIFKKMLRHDFQGIDWISDLEKIGVDIIDRKLLNEISDRIFEISKNNLRVFPQIKVVIPLLAEHVPIAIATNNCRKTIKHCLSEFSDFFISIKTFEDVQKLKPDPECLIAISNELDIQPINILFIGDTKEDVTAAAAAGTQIAIATWGQNQMAWLDELEAHEADKILRLSHPELLLQLINKQRILRA